MSTYYYRDGGLYTTKTMCNGKVTWQKECRVYPDEIRRDTMLQSVGDGTYRVVERFPKDWQRRIWAS